jgi:hypothetical protein
MARAYYFLRSGLDGEEKSKRSMLFGEVRDGLRPLKPYRWQLAEGQLLEIPVTTLPGLKMPFHCSYLHWLAGISETLASAYFAGALRACDVAGIAPSLLLHPLDFLGRDDVSELAFFPGMNQTGAEKTERMRRFLGGFAERYTVLDMEAYANRIADLPLAIRRPDFRQPDPGAVDLATQEV